MAHEFFLRAINETEYWDKEYLAPYNVLAAFGVYLIKNGERTHICSMTPSSWGVFVSNEFVLEDPEAEQPDGLFISDDNSDYFSFTPHNPDNPHHSPIFKIDGRFSNEKAWVMAEEQARTSPYFPMILTHSNFLAHELLMQNKRRAENRPLNEGLFA